MTQTDLILDYLRKGGSLTPLEALDKFGCMRLGARCYELRQRGHPVISHMVEVGYGKRVSEYKLEWLPK